MLRAAPPGVLKLLDGALDGALALEWRRLVGPAGVLVYRRVYAPGADLSQMGARVGQVLADAEKLRPAGPVALEVPFNEEDPNGTGLADLAEASVAAVDLFTAAGHDAVVLVLPEGNPADPRDISQPRVVAALRRMKAIADGRGRRVYLGFHGYTTPKLGPADPDHLLRYRELLALLPADVRFPVLLGETGIDGGIEGRNATGFRGYESVKAYCDQVLVPLRDELEADPAVAGAAVYGVAMNADWSAFDLGDEVDARPVFAFRGAAWRQPTPTPRPPTMYPDWCPFAVREPVNPGVYSTPRDGNARPAMICDHITDGESDPAPYWSSLAGDPSRAASAHFSIDRAGVLRQHVPLSAQAWSNGPLNKPDLANPMIAALVRTGRNPNSVTVSIEHWGVPAEGFTAAQLATSRRLHSWLSATFAIALDRTHVVGHYQFDSVNRAHCPSFTDATWAAVLAPDPAVVPPAPPKADPDAPLGRWPNGRRVASSADYDQLVWGEDWLAYTSLKAAAKALRDGGNGPLGDDAAADKLDALADQIPALKSANEQLHGVTR